MEQWRDVVGFEGVYEISDSARVRHVQKGTIKIPSIDETGRMSVLLWRNNKCRLMRIHRMLLLAFVGPCPPKHECCHNDGNASNNALSNLRWDTAQNNQLDRVKHGTSNRGERCGSSKLTEIQARAIIADPRKHKYIAADYGVRDSVVSRIKSGKRWGHLQAP